MSLIHQRQAKPKYGTCESDMASQYTDPYLRGNGATTNLGPGRLEEQQLAGLRKTFSDLVSQEVQKAVQKTG